MRKQYLAWPVALIIGSTLALGPVRAQAQIAVRVGVVNQDRVLNDSEEGKRFKADLEKLRVSKKAVIDAKEKEITELQDQLFNAQLSLSEEKRDEISRQLKRKRVEYERLNDDATVEFQEAASRAQARLNVVFREVIRKYGTEKGFTVILEVNALYYSSPTVDVTDDILTRFNEFTGASAGGASSPSRN